MAVKYWLQVSHGKELALIHHSDCRLGTFPPRGGSSDDSWQEFEGLAATCEAASALHFKVRRCSLCSYLDNE